MGSAKRDIDYFTETIASTKESLVVFHEATAVYSFDVDSLQAEIDALQSELKISQANLTKAQAGSVACEINLPAFEHCQAAAWMAYAAAHDTVRRMDRAEASTVGPTPSQAHTERTTTYDEDGIDSMEAVRDKEHVKTAGDVFMLHHEELVQLLRKLRDKQLPLVSDFPHGRGLKVLIKGGLEELRNRVMSYLAIWLDDGAVGNQE